MKEKLLGGKTLWSVDFPNPNNLEGPWINYGLFDTKEKALTMVKHLCSADDDGNINVLSEVVEVEDE